MLSLQAAPSGWRWQWESAGYVHFQARSCCYWAHMENLSYPEPLLTGSLSHHHPSKPHQATAEGWNSVRHICSQSEMPKNSPRRFLGSIKVLQCYKTPPRGQEGAIPLQLLRDTLVSSTFFFFPLQSEILDLGGAWEEILSSQNP